MKVIDILNDLREQGISVQLNNTNLKVIAKNKKTPQKIVSILKENKQEIIKYLSNINVDKYSTEIKKVDRRANIALSFAQQRLWFLNEYMGPSAVYNMPLALRLRGDLNVEVLNQSLLEILCRHEALRTRFESIEGNLLMIRH